MRSFCLRFFALMIMAALWIVSLAGCSGAGSEARAKQLLESFSQNYESDLACTVDGLELGARISRPNPGAGVIEVTSPQNLAGLSYRLDADQMEVGYLGLSFVLDKSAGAAGGLAPLPKVLGAMGALLAVSPEELPQREGDLWRLDAQVDGQSCSLLIAEATGLPVKLLLENGDLEIALENFVFLG